MAYPNLPTLASPFTFVNGQAAVNEQDDIADVAACVYNLVVTPQGFRDDQPDFGIPDPLFQTFPLDLPSMQEAIAASEPRAVLAASQTLTAPDAASIVELVRLKETTQ